MSSRQGGSRGPKSAGPGPVESAASSAADVRRRVREEALAAGAFACVVAILTLLGWVGDVDILRRGGTSHPPMMPNTAVALLALGASLMLMVGRPARVAGWAARSAAFLAAVAGLLTLVQYLSSLEMYIDLLLFPRAVSAEGLPFPGRIEPASALSILLLGTALTVYDSTSDWVHRVAEIMVVAVAVVALETLFGRAFGMDTPYRLGRFPAMPIHSAVSLLGLSVGIALLRPDRGWFRIFADTGGAGTTLRRLIPVSMAVPFLIGWVTYLGVTSGLFSAATGLTLLVSCMCLLLLVSVAFTAGELKRIDEERVSLLRSAREARDEAERANAAKSDFLGVMSHELRTPLNSVISYAELLEIGVKGPLNEQQIGYVQRIRVGASHLCSMIDELLQFTRASRGAIEADLRPVDAVELAVEALAVVDHAADGDVIELCHELPTGPVEIHTDRDKVLHILVNLLGNALKFTKEGRVGLRLLHDDRGVTYEVWDTGPGIPREDRVRIFEEFTQLDTHTNGRKGTGLGLAISRSFAELVGGKIELDSWVGKGSVFRLVLPSGDRSVGGRRPGTPDPTPLVYRNAPRA
jgi:signal transduction histidine kinase